MERVTEAEKEQHGLFYRNHWGEMIDTEEENTNIQSCNSQETKTTRGKKSEKEEEITRYYLMEPEL